MPLVHFNDKYLSYSDKLASYESGPPPYIPDSVSLNPTFDWLEAADNGNIPVTTVTSSINGVASDWTAAKITGTFFSVNTETGVSGTPVYISITANTGSNPRQGTIDVSCGDATATFNLCQDGTMILCSDL